MRGRVFYDLSTGRATDFDNECRDLELRFCFANKHDEDVDVVNYVIIDGVLCFCCEFQLFGEYVSFRVCPAAAAVTARRTIEPVERSPVATVDTPTKCNLEAVAETFNRLSRIERETSQDVLVCETLCGMLVAAGYEVRIDFVSTLVDLYPVGMTPDNLKQTLAIWGIEHTERDHSGPVPPPAHMVAMMTEGLKNDE